MNNTIKRFRVVSSHIVSIGHDNDTQILEVEFPRSGVWHYNPVTKDQFKELLDAPSVGSHFHNKIKTAPGIKGHRL